MKRGALRKVTSQELLNKIRVTQTMMRKTLERQLLYLEELRRRERLPPMPGPMDDPRGPDMSDELGPAVDEILRGGF